AEHEAAAIARIDLVALAHSPVDRAVGSVADDRAVGQPTRRLEGALGSQRRRVVQGSDEELLAWLARHEPADELADARGIALRIDCDNPDGRMLAFETVDGPLDTLGQGRKRGVEGK